MPGFSVTLLRLPTEKEESAPPATLILSLLDEKPDVPGWKWSSGCSPLPLPTQISAPYKQEADTAPFAKLKSLDSNVFLENIKRAACGLIAAEPDITRMDSIAGDGDCGLTLKVLSKPFNDLESCLTSADRPALKVRGSNNQTFWFAEFVICYMVGVLAKIDDGTINGDDVVRSMITIATVAEEAMGGTSGALYSYVVRLGFTYLDRQCVFVGSFSLA